MIAHYQNDDSWQTELLEELQRDRIGMIEDQTGDSTVGMLVDTSLRMVDGFVAQTLMAMGTVPEDVCHDRMNRLRNNFRPIILGVDQA